jgi:hypothetical protein
MPPSTAPSKPAETRFRSRFLRLTAAGDPVLLAGMALLVVYYVATRGVFQGKASGDGWFGFMYLRAIFFEHTLDMKTVIPEYLPYFSSGGPHHAMPNRCPFGPVLIWAPFYLIAVGVAKLGALMHLVHPMKGGEPFFSWFTGLGTLALTLVGYRAMYVMLLRHVGRGAALIGSTVAVWATPIAWYAVTQPAYQHGLAFGLVALLVERWDARYGDPDWRRFAWLGVLGGLAMEMRAQEALFLLLPGVEALVQVVRGPERKRWLIGGVVLCAATLIAFWPQVMVWHWYTGAFRPVQVEPLRWGTPFILVALFSTRGGLFPWSPIAYAATAGLVVVRRFAAPTRRLALALTALFLVEIYIVASAWVVTSGYAYGARRLSDGAVVLGLLTALLWQQVSEKQTARRLLAAFVALCVLLNVLAMELVRARRVPSSGGYARTAGKWLDEAKAPKWMGRFFEKVGYPFVQPVGWLFALWHHAPASAFEGVVGNLLLDRDGQWFTVLTKSLNFDQFNHSAVVEGMELPENVDKTPARVTGRVRLLLSMFAKERIEVQLIGTIPPGPIALTWNGAPIVVNRANNGARFSVDAATMRAGVNAVTLELPAGSELRKLELQSTSQWWK